MANNGNCINRTEPIDATSTITDSPISMSIDIGNYEVLSTGCVISPESQDIDFRFNSLWFRISFSEERDDKGQLTQPRFSFSTERDEATSQCYLKITMLNQEKSFFSSTTSLVEVATLKGRRLCLKFCINSLNNSQVSNKEDKIFFYTWLWKKS